MAARCFFAAARLFAEEAPALLLFLDLADFAADLLALAAALLVLAALCVCVRLVAAAASIGPAAPATRDTNTRPETTIRILTAVFLV